MNSRYISPFKPKLIKDLRPKNLKIYTFHSGFKKKKTDLLVLVFDKLVPLVAAYSKTSTPSAPIIWDKQNNKGFCKVLIVNSGNANAHTGEQGINTINKYVKIASKIFNCKKSEILVSSTGVIGEKLNAQKIIDKLNFVNESKSQGILEAAKSIMTTDTFPKTNVKRIKHNIDTFNIYGFAKGSGMVKPNMGTMLAYIFIDYNIPKKILHKLLKNYLDTTFNSISVDGDTSTSDTIVLFSTGLKLSKSKLSKNLLNKISSNLNLVMQNLSRQIVSDGEGISKLIDVEVFHARNNNQAKKVAFSVAESLLVKTAIAGEDANWGRIVMAIGKADEKIDQNKIIIKFNNLIVSKNGKKYQRMNINALNKYMKNKNIIIKVDLGIGKHYKKVSSSDLTDTYLRINSDYRT